MTPSARLQAAIEILDEVIASARDEGPAADTIVSRYFKHRRYAGSKDRRAVRELVFSAIRNASERPATGRAAILGLRHKEPGLLDLFGQPRGPVHLAAEEEAVAEGPAGPVPPWLEAELSPLLTPPEWPALLARAPLDMRVNIARTTREEILNQFEGAEATRLSPWGIRLPAGTRIDDHPAYAAGLVEVQDEGSQLVALACEPSGGSRIVDLCAGAGGKSLALSAAAPSATILAADTNRTRLSRLIPRAARAGATIETLLLSPPRELESLKEWQAGADLVLIDAPCSGSGTWRRNPEGRWRLTRERLERLLRVQARLLRLGAELVKPGGHLVYAVCSVLSQEGAGQIGRFLADRSSWIREQPRIGGGRPDEDGWLLTPGHDRTDGFFVARLRRS